LGGLQADKKRHIGAKKCTDMAEGNAVFSEPLQS